MIDFKNFETWLRPEPEGLFCVPGNFYIDPMFPVDCAIVTHAHSDHARAGLDAVLATRETLDIMKFRLAEGAPKRPQVLKLQENIRIGDVEVSLSPAGHILGSAQVVITYGGQRAVVSGDYKRSFDATCTPFEIVKCDLFVTEATFGLPIFSFGDAALEVRKLLNSVKMFPNRTHQIGVYGLGKCQRVISLLRAENYDKPIWLHGAMRAGCNYYKQRGFQLGDLRPVAEENSKLPGEIVLGPPSALNDLWSRRFEDPVNCLASGWMQVRGRARQRNVELPLIISDHSDWSQLLQTVEETGASDLWVTHGREEALIYEAGKRGLNAKALSLVGREDEAE